VDVREILLETSENLSPNLEKNNVAIALEGATDPVIIKGDRDQLRQVFTNLIENAIKYGGPHKTITVALGDISHQKPLRGVGTVVHVTDHGEGIGAEHISRLTERFYRVDKHRSREVGGTGLGLSIVKHIISRHRGRLEIESVLGEGSTFSVFLPRYAAKTRYYPTLSLNCYKAVTYLLQTSRRPADDKTVITETRKRICLLLNALSQPLL